MPLLWLSLAFLGGILCAAAWGGTTWGWGLTAGSALVILLLLRRAPGAWGWPARVVRRVKFAPFLLLVAFAAGGWRWAQTHPPLSPTELAYWNGNKSCVVEGWVSRRPTLTASGQSLRLEAERVNCGEDTQAVRGAVQVLIRADNSLRYGERLRASGELLTPPEDEEFSYRSYLASQGVYSWMPRAELERMEGLRGSGLLRWLEGVRSAGLEVLERLYPPDLAALLQGILLGVDDYLPRELMEDFRSSGLAHIIAISGFNMVILATLAMTILRRGLRGGWPTAGAVGVLGLYALLVGLAPSVVRAALMCSVALAALRVGRPAGGSNAMGVSAAVMCFFDPNLPWDVSFQLSFAATLGLVLFSSPLQEAFGRWLRVTWPRLRGGWAQRITGWTGEYLLTTLAAQALTLPLIAWHFRRVSLVSFLANPLVLPAQAPLMVLGLASLALGALHPWLGQVAAWLAWPFGVYTIAAVRWSGGFPWAEVILPALPGWVALGAMGLLVALYLARKPLRLAALRPFWAVLPLLAAAVLLGRGVSMAADGRLHLIADSREGQTVYLLQTPRGHRAFLGGKPAERFPAPWLPPFTGLDALVFPAGAEQKGMEGWLPAVRPARVVWCPDARRVEAGFDGALREAGAEALDLPRGGGLELDGVQLRNPGGETGCGLRLTYGRLELDLPFAADEGAEEVVLRLGDGSLIALPGMGWLHLQSDGTQLWLEQGSD